MAPLIALDLDDTLVDTSAAILSAHRNLSERYLAGISATEAEIHATWAEVTRFFPPEDHFTVLNLIRSQFGRPPLDRNEQAGVEALYDQSFFGALEAVEGAIEMLNWLDDRRWHVAVVSNGYAAYQERKITQLRLDTWFHAANTFIAETFPYRKPYPEMIIRAQLEASAAVSRTFVVGDAVTDVIAGNSAGATTVLVARAAMVGQAPVPKAETLQVCRPAYRVADLYEVVTLFDGFATEDG